MSHAEWMAIGIFGTLLFSGLLIVIGQMYPKGAEKQAERWIIAGVTLFGGAMFLAVLLNLALRQQQ